MTKLIYLVGIPGCGKSTWAETNKDKLNAVIHSSDAIREEFGDVNDQSKNTDVFQILHSRIKMDLKAGNNVIYDATNLNRKRRVAFLNEIKNIPCEKICILFATPWEMCLARNYARDRHVPEDVMVRMYKNFQTPTLYEGWDDVQIVWADYQDMLGYEFDICVDFVKWKTIEHDNPHHSLSIGNHMFAACDAMREKTDDTKLIAAALLHDCGKPYTKEFIDSHGNHCDVAHFYQHQCAGSYLGLFYLRRMFSEWTDADILYVSLLINLHMNPFLSWDQSASAKEKDRKLFGDKVIADVELLHECDLAAH